MEMRLFDTHCHLDVSEFDADREAVLTRSRTADVSDLLIPGIEFASWPGLVALCHTDPGLHLALGLHPVYLDRHTDEHICALPDWIEREQPVAVGEIGLDFAIDADRERQIVLFEAQLAAAREASLPVVLHVRKSHEQILQCLQKIPVAGGICHAFNGSLEQAAHYRELGFKLGFGGMLTYERSSRLRRLAKELPLTDLVLETDAPDLTVASHQYQRNSPEYLPEVLAALAEVREMDQSEVAAQTTANALQVLGL